MKTRVAPGRERERGNRRSEWKGRYGIIVEKGREGEFDGGHNATLDQCRQRADEHGQAHVSREGGNTTSGKH